MSFKNLSDYLSFAKKKGLLKQIKAPVDPYLEVTEIANRLIKSQVLTGFQEGTQLGIHLKNTQLKGSPIILFEDLKGLPFPLVINLFGSETLTKLSLGVNEYSEISKKISNLLTPEVPKNFMEKLKTLPKLAELANIMPKVIKVAPCQEATISPPSLDTLPIMHCWPEDAGRFITLGLVITEDPELKTRNVGIYRMQVLDSRTTAMHWQIHKGGAKHWQRYKHDGKSMPVAVALGCDPVTIFSAVCPLPEEIDELLFAGFLRGEAVEVVKCKTSDLEVPAHAEFVLEGYVDPNESCIEGPFGDHTGFYTMPDTFPVFHITAITHKKGAIYPSTIVGIPPMEDAYLGKAIEQIFLPMIKTVLPEIIDMDFPIEGAFHNCVLVSIKKRFPGHGKKVINALWGMGQLCYTRLIVVVPENINVHDYSQTAWWVLNCFDPAASLVLSQGPLDDLDHASNTPRYGTKMGIDATIPLREEGRTREWPNEIAMNAEIIKKVTERWKEYGI